MEDLQQNLIKIAEELKDLEGEEWVKNEIDGIMDAWKQRSRTEVKQLLADTEYAVREMKNLLNVLSNASDGKEFLGALESLDDTITGFLFGRNASGERGCMYTHLNDDLEHDVKRMKSLLRDLG